MKIVLNSDILLSLKFAQGVLAEELSELCTLCHERGVAIVLPETTLLEFERRHAEFAEKEVSNLAQALLLLDRFSIAHDAVDPQDVVKEPNLVALLEGTGAIVEVVSPGFEDFREAHRRACKHLPPTTEKKSDEMRDVVIWLVALGIAQQSKGAVLIARDGVFHDARVDEEAEAVGLIRVGAVEDAIDRVRGLKPAPERLAALLVSSIRDDVIAAGIHVPDHPDRYHVSNPVFTLDDEGLLARAEFRLEIEEAGVKEFRADLIIAVREGTIVGVSLTEIESAALVFPSNALSLTTNRTLDLEAAATAAGLSDVAGFGGLHGSDH